MPTLDRRHPNAALVLADRTVFLGIGSGCPGVHEGELVFNGTALPTGKPHLVVAAGIARTFQNIRLFREMTALENVMAGHHIRSRANPFAILLQTRQAREEERLITERAYELLRYVGIERFADTVSKNLSYGDQRRLEIARALATDPKLIALDEPAAGMNATEKVVLRELIDRIRNDGRTILLIEHDVKLVMGLCDRVTVLDYGKQIAEGNAAEVQRNEKVIEAYLGADHKAH